MKSFVRLVLVTMSFIFNGQTTISTNITCVAGTFYVGEVGRISCFFNQDINTAMKDFNVGHYSSFTFEEAANNVLACNWRQAGHDLDCRVRPGFLFDKSVADSLVLVIPAVNRTMEGTYVCSLVSDEASRPTPCNLTVIDRETAVTEAHVTTTDRSDQESTPHLGVIIGLLAALVVLFITTLILVVGCTLIRCKYRLVRRTGMKTSGADVQDAWSDIICCTAPRCPAVTSPSTAKEEEVPLHEAEPLGNGGNLRQDTGGVSPTQPGEEDTLLLADRPRNVHDFGHDGHSASPTSHQTVPVLNASHDHDHRTVEDPAAGRLSHNDAAVPTSAGSAEAEADTDDQLDTAVTRVPALRSPAGTDYGQCLICCDTMKDPKAFSCGHRFCTVCLDSWLKVKPVCPKCGTIEGVMYGDQPRDGKMAMFFSKEPLPGHDSAGSFVIRYIFPAGRQTEMHPHPNRSYAGTERVAYLPDTKEGRTVLMLMKIAFDRRLIFTIALSLTNTNTPEGLVWNGILHKTSRTGGETRFGYPDTNYLETVQNELSKKGVTQKCLKENHISFIRTPHMYGIYGGDSERDFSTFFEALAMASD